MRNVMNKFDKMFICAKTKLMQKKPGVDQIIIMFIIIAVAQRLFFPTSRAR